ncbi:unnamed protein product, partial [Hapterophycus canaliculatus]
QFVIVAAYDHTDPSRPVEERIAFGVKRCGVSITYTSLTNFFAFLLGSNSALPAVEYFCLYACPCCKALRGGGDSLFFLCVCHQQMTAFVALLTMDVNRQKAGKIDWCCCFTSSKGIAEQVRVEGPQRGVNLPAPRGEMNQTAGNGIVEGHDLGAEVHELSAVGKFMKNRYAPLLLSTKAKVFVLLGAAALFAAGVYGATQYTQAFDVLDSAPDGHYSREYTELARSYEVDISEWFVPLKVYTREVEYTDVAVQAEIQATDERMLELDLTSGPLGSWLVSFVEWAENSTGYSANVGMSGGYPVYGDPDTFYTALSEFTAEDENAGFLSDVIFNDNGTIEISRSEMYLVDQTDTTKKIDTLEDTRDTIDQSTLESESFGFSGGFVVTEQYLVIVDELLASFGLALVAVLVLSLFVLGKITVVVLVCVTVLIIDVELFGFIYHWNLDVNSITVI